jgi:hypothetical protein
MKRPLPALALAFATMLAACAGDDYASVSGQVDELLKKEMSLTADDKKRLSDLLERSKQLHKDGKEQESAEALKQALEILRRAQDADLLRKSEG